MPRDLHANVSQRHVRKLTGYFNGLRGPCGTVEPPSLTDFTKEILAWSCHQLASTRTRLGGIHVASKVSEPAQTSGCFHVPHQGAHSTNAAPGDLNRELKSIKSDSRGTLGQPSSARPYKCPSQKCQKSFRRQGDRYRQFLYHIEGRLFSYPLESCLRHDDGAGFGRKDRLADILSLRISYHG